MNKKNVFGDDINSLNLCDEIDSILESMVDNYIELYKMEINPLKKVGYSISARQFIFNYVSDELQNKFLLRYELGIRGCDYE